MTVSRDESYAAIREDVVGRVGAVEVVTVSGPDARSYLQGQCSQDLDGLAVGDAVEALVLTPQGKLDAYVRVLCEGPDDLAVIVADGFGEALYERLRRFKLRVKTELELGRRPLVELRGPKASAPAGTTSLVVDWPGYRGLDLLGTDALPTGVEEGDAAAFEAARIEAGLPVMGRELDESTIPPEAGIVERTVSFTKGCYTGQELVARLDARGNRVARHLRGLVLGAEVEASAGEPLVVDANEVGALTSVAFSPARQRLVALGYVRRAVEPGGIVLVGGDAAREAEVLSLPFA